MKKYRWYIMTITALIVASSLGYTIQLMIFHNERDTFFYLLQDLAFLPVQVLLVTLVVNGWFQMREREELLKKTNVVVGTFFIEIGNVLLRYFSEFDVNIDYMRKMADIHADWNNHDFVLLKKRLDMHEYTIDCRSADIRELRKLLIGRREFIMGLLANPGLVENTGFSELLWAISHLTQELELRQDFDNLPDTDYAHLGIDIRRAYILLVQEWVSYIRRLKDSYPYMYSLMVRTDPFASEQSVIITK
ncbi:MAG: hypothetical protein ACYC0V_07710 [Armatimonadota bacterium]